MVNTNTQDQKPVNINLLERVKANQVINNRDWCRFIFPYETEYKGDTRKFIFDAYKAAIPNFRWHEEYLNLAEYVADNKGRGLMLQGNIGTGKTEFVKNILIPYIKVAHNRIIKAYNAEELNINPEELLEKKALFIDDIGREIKAKVYGNEINTLEVIANNLEQKDVFLIATTNLSTAELTAKYGERAIDRMKKYMSWVNFGVMTSQRNI